MISDGRFSLSNCSSSEIEVLLCAASRKVVETKAFSACAAIAFASCLLPSTCLTTFIRLKFFLRLVAKLEIDSGTASPSAKMSLYSFKASSTCPREVADNKSVENLASAAFFCSAANRTASISAWIAANSSADAPDF